MASLSNDVLTKDVSIDDRLMFLYNVSGNALYVLSLVLGKQTFPSDKFKFFNF